MKLTTNVNGKSNFHSFNQDLKETIDRLVGNINGAFSTAAWSPIRYIYGNINQNELSSFYRDAQVGYAMNLI